MKNSKISVKNYLLIFIETFSIWQMGIIYYSSKTLTINNQFIMPTTIDNSILIVFIGYILGIFFIYLFPKKTILVGRILMILSLLLTILLFWNINPTIFKLIYYILIFNCVVFISINTSMLINVYNLKSAVMDAILGSIVVGLTIAVCQNNIIPFNFTAFNIISLICLSLITFALFKLPCNIKTIFINKNDNIKIPPKKNIIGLIFIQALCCLSTLFTASLSQSITGGVSISYLGTFFAGLITFIFYKNNKLNQFKTCKYYFGICSIGFMLFLIPNITFKYIALFLQGFGFFNILIAPFLISLIFEKYPSKIIAPITVFIALITAFISSLLIEFFRDNSSTLYLIYITISIVNTIIYLMIEPNLSMTSLLGLKDDNSFIKNYSLSKREIDVTKLLIKGYSNKEIANALNISNYTVNDHIKNIYRKFNVHSRFELASVINKK